MSTKVKIEPRDAEPNRLVVGNSGTAPAGTGAAAGAEGGASMGSEEALLLTDELVAGVGVGAEAATVPGGAAAGDDGRTRGRYSFRHRHKPGFYAEQDE